MSKVNDGLPVNELHAVCEGGMMPMTYAEFFFTTSSLVPSLQARTVFGDWATEQYRQFLQAFDAPERPQYRILGLYHQVSSNDRTEVPMSREEAEVWLEQLAEFKQPFWSVWEPNLISDESFDLLKEFEPLWRAENG